MSKSSLIWLLLDLLSIVILGFYSMLEMACVSFNKVRLQYYVTKGDQRAIWLNSLLQNSSRLFGTTLICVNLALVIGSECSREFYSAIGLNPNLAPLTQVLLVVIFGELAPMFAARHFPEHVAMLGVPLIYFSAKVMEPILWLISMTSKVCDYLVGSQSSESNLYLTQEELQKVLEEQSVDNPLDRDSAEFSAIATNIFSVRNKTVKQIMEPIESIALLPSNATIRDMEQLLNKSDTPFVPIYSNDPTNIVAIAYPRDAIRASQTHRVRQYALPPWSVTEKTTMMHLLKQFRTNNESIAIILDKAGKAIGIVQLSGVLAEIFGKISYSGVSKSKTPQKLMIIDKTFSGNMSVGDFNAQFGVLIGQDPTMTLSELMTTTIGHHPEKGESMYITPFAFTVKETTLLEVKTISVSTSIY